MRGRVVVTTVALSLGAPACHEATATNPPPPAPVAAPPPAPVAAPPPAPVASPAPSVPVTSPHEHTRYVRVLNGVDAEQRRIFRNVDGTCYVHGALPPPVPGSPTLSFQPLPQLPVGCPPHMADPSWAACAFGTVQATEDGSACLCAVMGNPPAPPRTLPACPTGPAPTEPLLE